MSTKSHFQDGLPIALWDQMRQAQATLEGINHKLDTKLDRYVRLEQLYDAMRDVFVAYDTGSALSAEAALRIMRDRWARAGQVGQYAPKQEGN